MIKMSLFVLLLVISTCFQLTAQTSQVISLNFNKEKIEKKSNINNYQFDYQSNLYNGRLYRFITFEKIPNVELLKKLSEKDIQLLEYIPNNTYLASLPQNINKQLLFSLGVINIEDFDLKYKTSRRLDRGNFPNWAYDGQYLSLSVLVFKDISIETLIGSIERIGASISHVYKHANMFDIQLLENKLSTLIDLPFIRFVDLISEPGVPESDDGRNLHRSNAIDNDYNGGLDYDGTGIAIAINDDGYVGPHIDYTGRVNQDDVAGDLTGDHGDMCAGIAGGAGNLDPLMRGMAPASYLHIRQYSSGMGGTVTLHQDSAVLVFNSSYSNGCNGGYTNTTLLVDQEIDQNPTLMQTFSAGNSNNNDCGYGAGDQWGNITGGHKIGKNVIATANLNENDGIIASSSRGPASDGRIKPDISAHGNSQISTDPNNTYAPGGGTSAAAPGICGVMAQLHHAYQEMNGGNVASSSLLKATLLNTANELGNDGPDFIYGWGKVNAYKAVKLLEDNRYFSATIAQGDSNIHNISIPAGVQRAKIMVYWSDLEASTSASYALVNDLDATVIDPLSVVHYPWLLDHTPDPVSLATPAIKGEDHLNNVEQIAIDNPQQGSYTLKVKGNVIPFGAREYWVVYEFLYDDITVIFPMGGEGLIPGNQDRIHWDAFDDSGSFLIEYSENNGGSWTTINTVSGDSRFISWNVPTNVTGQGLIRVSRGSASDISDANFSIMERPQNIIVNRVCPDQSTIQLQWDSVPNATAYDVFMLGDKFMDSVGTTSNLQYGVVVPDVSLDYWFSVRARGLNDMVSLRQIAIEYSGSTGGVNNCFLSCAGDHDAGVREITSPSSFIELCGGANIIPVEVVIENKGLYTESNFPISYQYDNNPIETEIVSIPVSSGSTISYTFFTPINVSIPGQYELKVWTGLTNDSTSCNDTLVQIIDILNPNAVYPYQEGFEQPVFPTSDITIINPDSEYTWERTDVTGADGAQTNAVFVNNYSYNASGEEDIMQILTMDLNTGTIAQLSFDVAYYQYSATYSDDLRIDVSTDCGQTYTQLYFKDGATLSGGNTSTSNNWTPAASDWQQETIDISSYIGNTVTLRFVNINGYGQKLYLDNINIDVTGLPPICDFEANVTNTCDGTVEFTDLSNNFPTGWLWDFGDGNLSTQQNPTHTYSSSGQYTVSLQTSNINGLDTEIKNSYIDVEYPEIISTIDGEGCPNTSIELSAVNGSFSGDIYWYDSTALVHIGDTFNTPPLISSQTYTVQDVIQIFSNVGPQDNTIGGGGYHGSGFYGAINFTSETNFIIDSVWVDADGAGDRTIYLWDGNILSGAVQPTNNIIQQVTGTLVDGPQRIYLGIEVPSSGDFAIGGNQMNLFRNNGGAVYPYTTPGIASLTSSTATTSPDYYYYLYDWDVSTKCESPTQVVTAGVVDAQFTAAINGSTVTFTDNSIGAYSWLWDFGDGNTSTDQNPVHTYTINGPHAVILTINDGACSYMYTIMVIVNIDEISDNKLDLVLQPNPTNGNSNIIFSQPTTSEINTEILAIDGRVIEEFKILKGTKEVSLNVSSYPPAIYLIRFSADNILDTRRILKSQ